MRLLHARPDLFCRRVHRGGTRAERRRNPRVDERKPVSMRRVSEHRRGCQKRGRREGTGMNPFAYSRVDDPQRAIAMLAADPRAKVLAGGTNLVDLMKMGVETPTQLVDINRVALARIEMSPDGL